jgi:hypothetical protein
MCNAAFVEINKYCIKHFSPHFNMLNKEEIKNVGIEIKPIATPPLWQVLV